jgi:long-subunit acyl-CoA synthetase (AMP-forming)
VFNNYGCAEAMPRLTLRQAAASDQASNVGTAIDGVELRLGDEGELLFKSEYGAKALQDADGLREIGPGEWLPSGDLAQAEPDGSWRLLGRANEVFKRFGEKVSMARLLETVKGGGWQAEAQFYREQDAMGEEGYVLLLSPAPDEAEMRTILRSFRANYSRTHWPLRVESVEHMPQLPSGKINLTALGDLPGKKIHWRNRI